MRLRASLCIALTLLLAATIHAQAPLASLGGWSIGPIAGLNYTTVYGSDATGAGSRLGFMAGGQLEYDLGPTGVFTTGLVYSRRGSETTDNGETITFKPSYLEIPLLLGYRFPTSSGARPYLQGGAHIAFKVGCSLEDTQGGVTASIDCDDPNVGASFSSTDFALVGGGGILIPVGTNHVNIDVRYALGLQKVEKSSEIKNRGFTFSIAYMVPVGR